MQLKSVLKKVQWSLCCKCQWSLHNIPPKSPITDIYIYIGENNRAEFCVSSKTGVEKLVNLFFPAWAICQEHFYQPETRPLDSVKGSHSFGVFSSKGAITLSKWSDSTHHDWVMVGWLL